MLGRSVQYDKYYSNCCIRRIVSHKSYTRYEYISVSIYLVQRCNRTSEGETSKRSLGDNIAVETVSGASAVRQYKCGPICIDDDQFHRETRAAHPWLRLVDEGARRRNTHAYIYIHTR